MSRSYRSKAIGLRLFLLLTLSTQLLSSSWNIEGLSTHKLCGDLLEIYAEKPKNLIFKQCKRVESSQTLVEAHYEVSGKNAKAVEDFLVKNYGMGKLQWVCCGWESRGKYGGFEHKNLTKIDPYLSGIITMGGSGEIFDENGTFTGKLEFDREKVPFFHVIVSLVIV